MVEQRQIVRNRIRLGLTAVAALLAVGALGYIAYLQIKFIQYPGPMELRECAMLLSTDLLNRGGNPYNTENLPTYINVYGVGYNWLVLPFAKVFGFGFATHRAVSAAFTLLCSVWLFIVMRGRRRYLLAFTAAVLFYADLAARTMPDQAPFGTPMSSLACPDAPGFLLFLISVFYPWRDGFKTRSLVVSSLAGAAAFFVKPYFIVGTPVVLAYVFLFRSKSRGLTYGGLFAAVFGVIAGFAMWRSDWFFTILIRANNAASAPSFQHLCNQIFVLARSTPGILALFFVAAFAGLRRALRMGASAGWRRVPVDFTWFAMSCHLVLLLVKLAPHQGNMMRYFYELFTPYALIIVIRFLSRHRHPAWIGLLLLDCVLLVGTGLPKPPVPYAHGWARWREIIAGKQHIYAAPPVAWYIREQGNAVYDTGMSEYIIYAIYNRADQSVEPLRQHVAQFKRDLDDQVQDEKFDLIIVGTGGGELMPTFLPMDKVKEHYDVVQWIEFPMDWSPGYGGYVLKPKGIPRNR